MRRSLRRQVGTLLSPRVELEGGCLNERVARGGSGLALRELERRDEAIAVSLETLGSLRGRTRALGVEAARLAAVLDRLPRERTAAASVAEPPRGHRGGPARRGPGAGRGGCRAVGGHANGRRVASGRSSWRAPRSTEPRRSWSPRTRPGGGGAGEQATAECEAAAVVSAAAAVARELDESRAASRVPAPPGAGLAGVTDWAWRGS